MKSDLNVRRERFLRDCESSLKPTELVMDDNDVTPQELTEWLDDAEFKESMKQLRRRLSIVRELDIARGGMIAAKRLLSGAFGRDVFKNRDGHLRVLLNLVKLARFGLPRKEKPSEPEVDASPGYHPSVSRQQAESLLADLQAANK